jgi:hypothetical protein
MMTADVAPGDGLDLREHNSTTGPVLPQAPSPFKQLPDLLDRSHEFRGDPTANPAAESRAVT